MVPSSMNRREPQDPRRVQWPHRHGGHTRSSRSCHSSAGVRWRHGWSTASVGQHGKIELARRYGAPLGDVWRRCRVQKAGASPQVRFVRSGPIDGGHTRSSPGCHSSAVVRWRHGWSTASVGQHGKIERARQYGAKLGGSINGAKLGGRALAPRPGSVCSGPIDGGHTCASRECHSSAGVRWRHGWSTASVGQHDKIERAPRYGAKIGGVADVAELGGRALAPRPGSVCSNPIDGGHTRASRGCHSSAGVRCRHGWSSASVDGTAR